MPLQLREQTDPKRLFSALGDALADEGSTSLAQFEESVLAAPSDEDMQLAFWGLLLSMGIAAGAAWSAIQAYERNNNSMGRGLAWGVLGAFFPLPTVLVTTFIKD